MSRQRRTKSKMCRVLKAGEPVVGRASLQNPQQRLLHQIVNSVAFTRQVNEMTNEPVLILLAQRLSKNRFFPCATQARFGECRFPLTPPGQLIARQWWTRDRARNYEETRISDNRELETRVFASSLGPPREPWGLWLARRSRLGTSLKSWSFDHRTIVVNKKHLNSGSDRRLCRQ